MTGRAASRRADTQKYQNANIPTRVLGRPHCLWTKRQLRNWLDKHNAISTYKTKFGLVEAVYLVAQRRGITDEEEDEDDETEDEGDEEEDNEEEDEDEEDEDEGGSEDDGDDDDENDDDDGDDDNDDDDGDDDGSDNDDDDDGGDDDDSEKSRQRRFRPYLGLWSERVDRDDPYRAEREGDEGFDYGDGEGDDDFYLYNPPYPYAGFPPMGDEVVEEEEEEMRRKIRKIRKMRR